MVIYRSVLPDMVVNSKLLKKILSINAFDFSVTPVGLRTSDEKKIEDKVSQN